MERRNFQVICIAILAILSVSNFCFAKYSGGSGEPNDPYRIGIVADWQQLMSTSVDWNKCFIMTANVNLSGTTLTPVGNLTTQFTGVFDGDGHIIKNLKLDINASMVGLFGDIYASGIVKNIYLEGLDIKALGSVGGIAGRNTGTIQNCHVSGTIEGEQACGGITGACFYSSSKIINCSFEGRVSGTWSTGGIVGNADESEINNCYAIMEIIGEQSCGGIAGRNTGGNISSCFAKGTITCSRYVGGLVGDTSDYCGYGGIISNCYADVIVNCSQTAGGFSGSVPGSQGQILNCYCSGKVIYDANSYSNVGGFIGEDRRLPHGGVFNSYFLIASGPDNGQGKPLTDEQMKQQASFIGWGGEWTIDNGNDYPRLVWEGLPGQLIPAPTYGGGLGTVDAPFLIYTPEQLNTIGLALYHMDMHFKLMADIDLSNYTGTMFNIIGSFDFPFTGAFDGNNKKVLNFSYQDNTRRESTGLFGLLNRAEIKSINLVEPNVIVPSDYDAGALIGHSTNSNIIDCYVIGGIVKGRYTVGGLIGSSSSEFSPGDIGSQIDNCWASCYVEGVSSVGGLVGQNNSRIYNSYSISTVKGDEDAGGLCGWNCYGGSITGCYSTGNVSGGDSTGGLCGYNYYGSDISNCYSTGNVTGTTNTGGLCGINDSGIITSCYFLDTAGLDNGLGTPLTDEQMKQGSSFINWDFSYSDGNDAVWFVPTDEYPILVWQISPADIYTDGENNFKDFAVFAGYWMREDCAIYNYYCEFADMDFDHDVDIDDLMEFMSYWLEEGIY